MISGCSPSWRRSARVFLVRYLVGLAGLVSSIVTVPGLAEVPSVAKAREYFRAGAQAYSVGEYAAAIQAFEQAYALAPRPAVLFSIAQAERRQYFLGQDVSHLRRAIEMYRSYLSEDQQSPRKTDAVQALSELEPLLAAIKDERQPLEPAHQQRDAQAQAPTSILTSPTRLMISSPVVGATIALDDHHVANSPVVREVAPGDHRVRVEAPGYQPTERQVVAVAGELVNVDVPLQERPAVLEVQAPTRSQLAIDGRIVGYIPLSKPVELPSGMHVITVTKNGFVGISREEWLNRGQIRIIRAPLRSTPQRKVAKFLAGGSASMLITGGIFAYLSHRQDTAGREFLDSRGKQRLSPDNLAQYNSTRGDSNLLRGAAWLAIGTGIGLGVTSAMLWFNDGGNVESVKEAEKQSSQSDRKRKDLFAHPFVGPGFGGLGIQGSF